MSKESKPIKSSSAYMKGMDDCKNGVPHKAGMHNDYDRGYAAQYEFEQVKTAQTGWA